MVCLMVMQKFNPVFLKIETTISETRVNFMFVESKTRISKINRTIGLKLC